MQKFFALSLHRIISAAAQKTDVRARDICCCEARAAKCRDCEKSLFYRALRNARAMGSRLRRAFA